MDDLASAPTEVLSGTTADGLRWSVVASGTDAGFFTMLHVYRDGRQVAGSGFGGPKLPAGSVLNEWRGKTDDLPYFVMARTAPHVDRVVAMTDKGTEIKLAISAPDERFGLRFAAAALPQGERPASLRAECVGITLETRPQPVPPR